MWKRFLRLSLVKHVRAFLENRGVERVTLVGNSMGCAVICEFAHLYPEQLARDGVREPPRLMRVAVPDYVRFGCPAP